MVKALEIPEIDRSTKRILIIFAVAVGAAFLLIYPDTVIALVVIVAVFWYLREQKKDKKKRNGTGKINERDKSVNNTVKGGR